MNVNPGRSAFAALAGLLLVAACEPERTTVGPPVAASRGDHGDGDGRVMTTFNPTGTLGTVSLTGGIDRGNPFFASLGTNGRSCATCHLQGDGFGISAASVQSIYYSTRGTDPLFAAVDGANCPDVPARSARGRSLLLNHGLIRVGVTPPATAEFTVTAVRDPYGCAIQNGEVSVYRRPLPTTNLRFLSVVMWDGRETLQGLADRATVEANLRADLVHQAQSATLGHAQASRAPTAAQLNSIVDFELGLFSAQWNDRAAGRLTALDARGGPLALARTEYYPGINDPLGGNPTGAAFDPSAFTLYQSWRTLGQSRDNRARASVARGEVVFNTHPLSITGVTGLNDALSVATIPGTCTTCHDSPDVGNHSLPVPLDIGVSHVAGQESDGQVAAGMAMLSQPEMPVFRVTCTAGPRAGREYITSDPGRALVTGKCADVGRMKGPILRALSSRAPFFHNGSAATLAQVVDFYNVRFQMGLSDQEKEDLQAFLRSL
ncbi:MAG: hypothetical protein U0133_06645 [Gemmatimonadales bacterium]